MAAGRATTVPTSESGGQQRKNSARIPLPAPPAVTAKVTPDARLVTAQTYIVRPGDTLRGIGNRTGAGSESIARENRLAPPYVIVPGQKLRIPGGRYHLVHEGDTGLAIAEAYGASWNELIALNALEDPFILRKGQRLLLPSAPLRDISPEERAAAFHLDLDQIVSGSAPAEAEVAAAPSPSGKPAASSFNGRFAWPVKGRVIGYFGPASNGVRNNGIDISVASGTPVAASASGRVTFASDTVSVFGGLVLIDHGSGWLSAYGYLSRIDVTTGQHVRRGQIIALSGDSGLGSAPKLHFETRLNRKSIDPLTHMPAR